MNSLSLPRINSKSPYKVKLSKNECFYIFITDQNIIYSISFSEEYEIGGCMSYQLALTIWRKAMAHMTKK